MVLLAAGCSVSTGEGEASGTVSAPGCDLVNATYTLDPTFFAASVVEGQLEIRVQRGSDFEDKSDGFVALVRNASLVRREHIGLPIDLADLDDGLATMTLYLNETCPPSRRTPPVAYQARSGTLVFQNIYAPAVDADDVEIAGHFQDVRFVDPSAPNTRFAVLSGRFRFLYNRGRPAQRFP